MGELPGVVDDIERCAVRRAMTVRYRTFCRGEIRGRRHEVHRRLIRSRSSVALRLSAQHIVYNICESEPFTLP
jgi:hypothetical protein